MSVNLPYFPFTAVSLSNERTNKKSLVFSHSIGPGDPFLSRQRQIAIHEWIQAFMPRVDRILDRIHLIFDAHFDSLRLLSLTHVARLTHHLVSTLRDRHIVTLCFANRSKLHIPLHPQHKWELAVALLLNQSTILPVGHSDNPYPYMILRLTKFVCVCDQHPYDSFKPVRVAWAMQNGFFTEELYKEFQKICLLFA